MAQRLLAQDQDPVEGIRARPGLRVALVGLAATPDGYLAASSAGSILRSGAPGSLVGMTLVTFESVLAVGSVQLWREQSRARREM
jgi:hypothetical protein